VKPPLKTLQFALFAVFAGFVLTTLGYFLVPDTAGDFVIHGPEWLVLVGKGLIIPLLLSDTSFGLAGSIALDAGFVFLSLSVIRWAPGRSARTPSTHH
jgi:hypothetical protein